MVITLTLWRSSLVFVSGGKIPPSLSLISAANNGDSTSITSANEHGLSLPFPHSSVAHCILTRVIPFKLTNNPASSSSALRDTTTPSISYTVETKRTLNKGKEARNVLASCLRVVSSCGNAIRTGRKPTALLIGSSQVRILDSSQTHFRLTDCVTQHAA